jgi:hypothetical protein
VIDDDTTSEESSDETSSEERVEYNNSETVIRFKHLYKAIYHYNFNNLADFVSEEDFIHIPDTVYNNKKLNDVDKYVYAILYKLSGLAIINKDHTIKHLLELIKSNNMNNMTIEAIKSNKNFKLIKNEYHDFLCNRECLNLINCYTTSENVIFKNNRFYLPESEE